ncbi:hypothetical protein C7M61_003566 [Candidozyma pseudohaemuli]|uniref:Uncharacterized protein n=1 Tax=Candidozyma pseudohaemuli TaxID=418784 RepID=A0A2P7YMF8_9ASCO|nr:hypothetical protein C7M61_003566 [[Candida] pseudohaemulonii]PSK37139.1 hypothetical protein C7M61_003566 [[Candida] pseudohaemulonii]
MNAYYNYFSATASLASKAITKSFTGFVYTAAYAAEFIEDFSQVNSIVSNAVTNTLEVPGTFHEYDFPETISPSSPEPILVMPGSYPPEKEESITNRRRSLKATSDWQTIELKSPKRASPSPLPVPLPAPTLKPKFQLFRKRMKHNNGGFREPSQDMNKVLTLGNMFLVLQEC